MKVIAYTKSDIQKVFESGVASGIDIYYVLQPDDSVENFVKVKLQGGFQCAILGIEQFAFNEMIPKFIKP